MSQAVLWAGWSPDTLTLAAHDQDGSTRTVAIPRKMPADWRYHLRLSVDPGGVLLRSAVAGRTLLERVMPRGKRLAGPCRLGRAARGQCDVYRGESPDGWHRVRWPHDVFRAAVAAPGGIALLSHRGRRVILSGHSRRQDQLAQRLAIALGADADSRVEILDATAGVLVVTAHGARASWQGVTRFVADLIAPVSTTPLGTPEIITAIVI